jgi:hypothetical protein
MTTPQHEEAARLLRLAGRDQAALEALLGAPVSLEDYCQNLVDHEQAMLAGEKLASRTQRELAGKGLDVWLRDKFFEQHAKITANRPSLTDGSKAYPVA